MTLEEVANEAWEYFRAMRNPNWTEEQNVKAVVRGALTSPFIEIDTLRAEIEKLHGEYVGHDHWWTALDAARKERDAALLQVGEAVALMQEVVWYHYHKGPGICTCEKCTDVRNFLTGHFAQKPVEAPCKQCWEDINGRWVHAGPCKCECHAEKRVEPSHNEAMESQDDD